MKSAPHVAGLLILAAATGLCAQKKSKSPKPPPAAPPRAVAAGPGRGAAAGGARPGANAGHVNNPLNPVQRFLNMTPEEQERVLEKAPPAQRERMIEALERWKSRPQAQREFAYRQYQSLAKLPPAQQAVIQRQMNAFNRLPEDRIKPVRQELIRLLRMPPEARAARFASPEFAGKYLPPEQQILRDLATTLPEDYPLAGK